MDKKMKKGIIFIILSALCFTTMGLFIRLSGELPVMQKSVFRNAISAIFAFFILIRKKDSIKKIEPKALGTLIFRSSFGTLGILCNYYAVDHLLLSDATMLLQLSPFFAIVFSFLILKERVVTKQMLIVIFAFIGALFVIKPSFTSMSMIPSLAGVCGGMFAGLAYTYVRKLGGMGMAGPFIVFFFSAFSCLSILPFAIMSYVPMSTSQIIYLLFAGLFACGGQFTMTTAYYSAPAKDISVYNYSSIIFAAILGFTFLGQIPDIYSIIGYIIILLMAYTMFKFNQNK